MRQYLCFLFLLANKLLRPRKKHADTNSVLVIQTAKMGDAVLSLYFIEALRQRYDKVYVLSSPLNREIYEISSAVTAFFEYRPNEKSPAGMTQTWKKVKAAVGELSDVVVLQPSFPAMFIAMRFTSAKSHLLMFYEAGFSSRLFSLLFDDVAVDYGKKKTVEYYLDFTCISEKGEMKNYDSVRPDIKPLSALLSVETEPGVFSLGLSIKTANPMKEWPAGSFAAFIRLLTASYPDKAFAVYLFGSEAEYAENEAFIQGCLQDVNVKNLCGKASWSRLPALMANLDAFVSVDTALSYMANIAGIPVLNIAGPCDARRQAPLGKNVVVVTSSLSCAPCFTTGRSTYRCQRGDQACLREITPETVLRKFRQIMQANSESEIK